MRLEMTMSESGPVPRSHSPLFCVRLSRFIRSFLLSEEVSQTGGLFVVFGLHRGAQPALQLHEFGLRGPGPAARRLAHVPAGAVDALQQRLQTHPEDGVVVGAAEPAL